MLHAPTTNGLSDALERCGLEPIHIPGAVQPYGVLLTLDATDSISQCGGTTEALFGVPPRALLGRAITDLVTPATYARLQHERATLPPDTLRRVHQVHILNQPEPLEAHLHRRGDQTVLEFVRANEPDKHTVEDWLNAINDLSSHVEDDLPLADFVQQVAVQLQTLSGYDRVMVYRFDSHWHGEVIAEAAAHDGERYLGLRFPASDIPPQARALYVRNRLRVLGDAEADPLPLVPQAHPHTGQPLDLSFATLRAMSPIHRQYLKNMRVRSTLVVSVLRHGQLWGLIACHHRQPRWPSAQTQRFADTLARLLAARLTSLQEQHRTTGLANAQRVLHRLAGTLTTQASLEMGLVSTEATLMELVGASGIAVVRQGQVWSRGIVPASDQLLALASWLDTHSQRVIVTAALSEVYPAGALIAECASGLLATRFADDPVGWLMWFRPEEATTVSWGGDPRTGLVAANGHSHLTPRQSFSAWIEQVRGRSQAWSPTDIALVDEAVRPNLAEVLLSASLLRTHQAEAQIRLILAQMPTGCLTLDLDFRITSWNAACERIFGWSAAEALGRTPFELIVPPEESDAVRSLGRELLQNGVPVEGEMRNTTKAEQRIWCQWQKAPLVTNGQTIGVLAMVQDVTRWHEVHAAMDQANQQYQLVTDAIQDVVLLQDRRGITQYVSPSCERLLGYLPDELLNRDEIHACHPDDRRAFLQGRSDALAGRSSIVEWRCKHREGHYIWVESVLSPVQDIEGTITGYVCCRRGIIQRKQVEDQLRQSQKLEAVGQLAGGVAHDFNNLLTVVIGCSDILLKNLPADDPYRPLVEDTLHAGERGASLTRQLLAFSRQQMLKVQIVPLTPTIVASCKMLARLIGEDITLVTDCDPEAGSVEADPGQVEQVLMNLMVNARDAMPQGGQLTVRTTRVQVAVDDPQRPLTCPPGSYARLTVSDTGAGMSPEVQARLFEPFFTTKPLGKGTGLGLATVHGIVGQARGFITMTSELNRGTTFHVYFPHRETTAQSDRSGLFRRIPIRGGETILVVEDDPSVRALTATILRKQGYDVLTAESGMEALAICAERHTPPTLVLTDVVMPHMSGRELVEQLNTLYPNIKVIFLSGYTSDAILRHGIQEDQVDFMQKPYTPDKLIRFVREVLDKEAPEPRP